MRRRSTACLSLCQNTLQSLAINHRPPSPPSPPPPPHHHQPNLQSTKHVRQTNIDRTISTIVTSSLVPNSAAHDRKSTVTTGNHTDNLVKRTVVLEQRETRPCRRRCPCRRPWRHLRVDVSLVASDDRQPFHGPLPVACH
jgi:hypothetical protein